MGFGICSICKETESKYKCPKCSIVYCSLPCFKSPEHTHDESVEQKVETTKPTKSIVITEEKLEDQKFKPVLEDKELQYLLSFKSLQYHLKGIYEILNDPKLDTEKRNDLANKKLSSLREAGDEQNLLVEEFCKKVVDLLNTSNST